MWSSPGGSNQDVDMPRLIAKCNRSDGQQLRGRLLPARHMAIQLLQPATRPCLGLASRDGTTQDISHSPDPTNKAPQDSDQDRPVVTCEKVSILRDDWPTRRKPGGSGFVARHTLIVCDHELGKGNSHNCTRTFLIRASRLRDRFPHGEFDQVFPALPPQSGCCCRSPTAWVIG